MKSNNQQLLQYYHHQQHQQISSFNPTCCLRPPPPPSPFLEANARAADKTSTGHHYGSKKKDVKGSASPRIGCMGQIKRSSSYNSRSSSSNNSKKLFQFPRMFSSSGKSGSSTSSSLMMVNPRARAKVEDRCCQHGISIADTMDPPLPVPKHHHRVVAGTAANDCNLWKRRRGRDGPQRLEIVQVKLQRVQHLRRTFSGAQNFEDQDEGDQELNFSIHERAWKLQTPLHAKLIFVITCHCEFTESHHIVFPVLELRVISPCRFYDTISLNYLIFHHLTQSPRVFTDLLFLLSLEISKTSPGSSSSTCVHKSSTSTLTFFSSTGLFG